MATTATKFFRKLLSASTSNQETIVQIEARQRFAEIVRDLRADRNLRSFARLVGVSHPTVIAWENGTSEPKRENLERIAALRGESLDQLLDYLEGTNQTPPQDRLLTVIGGASKDQLLIFLRAIADRLERI